MDTFTIIQESQPTKKVDISLRQLIDIDETGGIRAEVTTAEGNIRHNQILTAYAEQIDINGTLGKVKIFRFKNLVSLISGGTGIAVSSTAGNITTITNTGVTSIIAGTNISISPVTGIGNVTINAALGFTAEDTANKQNSLAVDGTGVKFPTVDAVNSLSMIDRGKRIMSYFFDFINASEGFITFNQVGGSITVPVYTAIPNLTSNQLGVVQYSTGTAATNYTYHFSQTAVHMWFGGGAYTFECSVEMGNLSTSLERFRTQHGFGSLVNNSSDSNGAFFTYDEGGNANGTAVSPNWQCVTSANNIRTLTTTSVAVTTTWTKLRIEVNATGTSIAFYVNGTLVATHTTNIPLFSASRFVFVKQGISKVIGTTARLMYCDYWGYETILTTPRT